VGLLSLLLFAPLLLQGAISGDVPECVCVAECVTRELPIERDRERETWTDRETERARERDGETERHARRERERGERERERERERDVVVMMRRDALSEDWSPHGVCRAPGRGGGRWFLPGRPEPPSTPLPRPALHRAFASLALLPSSRHRLPCHR
jgi:hypothetical protein